LEFLPVTIFGLDLPQAGCIDEPQKSVQHQDTPWPSPMHWDLTFP